MLVYAFDPYSNKGTIALSFICTGKQGRVMIRDFYNLYAKKTTMQLKTLRSQKYVRREKLQAKLGWWNEREWDMLNRTINAIDVELARREAQERLF